MFYKDSVASTYLNFLGFTNKLSTRTLATAQYQTEKIQDIQIVKESFIKYVKFPDKLTFFTS